MFQHRRSLAAFPLAAVLAGGLLAGCAEETVVDEAEEEGPAAVAAILGEPVTVQAEVQEVFGPRAFTIGEGETLVLTETEVVAEEETQMTATGTVRQFVTADFERDYDWFDFGDEDWVVDFDRELVIVADSVSPLP